MLEVVTRIKSAQKRAACIAPTTPRKRDGPSAQQRWLITARLNQLPPPGDWFVWLSLAGRGFGKTRTGAETIAQWARDMPRVCFALVAQTAADARHVMVEGESGLLSVLDESELRGSPVATDWNRSLGELSLRHGVRFKCYNSETPRKLCGPQHHGEGALLPGVAQRGPGGIAGAEAEPVNRSASGKLACQAKR